MVRRDWPGPRTQAHSVAHPRARRSGGRMKLLLFMVLALVVVNTNAFADSASALGKTSGTEPADTIFLNGDIYTQATPARAQAMAIRAGRILAVGTNDEIRKMRGAHTHVIDLGGHFVVPGFNDAHVHLEHAGLELRLSSCGSRRSCPRQECGRRVSPSPARALVS